MDARLLQYTMSNLSISNLAKLGNSASEIATTAVVDLIFGTAYSALSAAISKAVVDNNSKEVDKSNSIVPMYQNR